MFRTPKRGRLLLPVLLMVLAGCSLASEPLKATWEYAELAKDENGNVQEIGDRHTLRSVGDEMFEIRGKRLEVITVTSAKAKFRLSGDDSREKTEAELQPASGQDLWLGTFGVRLRLEKTGPL